MPDATMLPMFPLGNVLFTSMVLPLHVFEPRYRQLVQTCLEGGREFGVCLIERGSEVGGGDARSQVGTIAQIVEAEEFPDGRWALGAVGTRRIRVVEWLADAPHPWAMVEDWPDATGVGDADAELVSTVALLRRVLAAAAEFGQAVAPATIEIAPDPRLGSHQIAALAPIGPFDKQQLLEAPDAVTRLTRARSLLEDALEMLEFRRGG